jgi:hypothetical protein
MIAPSHKPIRVGCLVLIIIVKLVYFPLIIIESMILKIGCIYGSIRLHEIAGLKNESKRRTRNP